MMEIKAFAKGMVLVDPSFYFEALQAEQARVRSRPKEKDRMSGMKHSLENAVIRNPPDQANG